MTQKILAVLALVGLSVTLQGCWNGQQMKTTKITVDPETKQETTIIEEPVVQTAGGFFESANLKNHYEFEASRFDKHEKAVEKKIDAIQANVNQVMAMDGPTPNEKFLYTINANLLIDRIQTSPGQSGVKTPKTMADVADGQLSNWLGIGLQVWDRVDRRTSRGDDSDVSIANYGNGSVFYKSNKNSLSQQVGQYTLGDSQGDLSFAGSEFIPTVTNTDSNDQIETRTDSPSSKETTLW